MRTDIPFPILGISDNQSFDEQPPRTTSDAVNVRGIDPKTGRARGAQRSGTTPFSTSQVNGSNKIRDLQKVTFDNTTTTFANRASGSETTEFSKVSPTTSDSVNVRTDRQGNQVWIEGRASIVKYNPAGTKLWTLTLPTTDTGHQCLALAIDESDNVIVGVSSGGQQSTARLWSYAQEEDNKTRLLWEIDLGGYVEEVIVKNAKLYALVNKPDVGAAEVVTLESYDAPNPEETARWRTAPDANGLDIGADGSVFVAAQANTTRGLNPLAPNAGATSEDWNPTMLSQWGTRAWAWYDAAAEDAFLVTPITGAPNDDGGSIGVWYDMTGNGRHLYGADNAPGGAIASRDNPTLRLRGSSGKPSVFFNGTTSKMISGSNANVTDDFQQLSTLPGYTGSMFVLCAVVKMNEGATDRRWLFGQRTAAGQDFRFFLNVDADSTFPQPNVAGSCEWNQTTTTTNASGLNTKPNNYPFTSLHPWSQVASSGSRNLPNGWMVITLCFTSANAGFSSFVRVNGNPVDVWTDSASTWTDGFQLGEYTTSSTGTTQSPSASYSFFPGEVMELLVLREYRTSTGLLQLIEAPGAAGTLYPDVSFSGIPNTSNTEVEKIEGYLAHKWGCAHVLPAGTAARLTFSAQVANNDTVTVGATTYRFRDVNNVLGGGAQPFTQANDVLIGATANATALNLIRAINLSGTSGTTYEATTAINASMWAFPQRFNEDADTTPAVMLRSLTKITSPTIATTETGANLAFTAATAQTSLAPDAAGENTGFYPHPFSDKRVYNTSNQIISTGGPPRQSNSDYALPSRAALLYSPYGLLAKHADSGRPRWVATSEHNTPTVAIGGVGYHVRIGSGGEVFSCGARQAAVNGGSADNVDVRRIVDSGDSFSLTGSAWTAAPGALTYAHPRMEVDKYDNLYLPFLGGASGSVIVYHKTAGTVLLTATGITEDPVGYAVAIDPNYPEFPDGYSNPRARFIYLASTKTSSSYALFKVGLVSQVAANIAPRSTRLIAVAGTGLRVVKSAGAHGVPAGTPSGFDATSKLVCSTVLHRKVYYTDGVSYFVYDPKIGAEGTCSAWAATSSGVIPERMRLICTWRARIVLARSSDNPAQWAMSKLGDPLNWDFFPADITADQAVIGTTARAGLCPDVVNALVPYSDDLLIFGGDSSVWRLTGDPLAGGQFDLVSDITGMSFGPCWDKDPNGTLYFFGSRGGVYRMAPGGIPVSMTDGRIERRMRDVDLSVNYVRCIWDTRENGLHVYVIPYGAETVRLTHWFWEAKTDAWWEDEFGRSSDFAIQPTSAITFDGDDPDDRRVYLGCGDGVVRIIDEDATNDDFGTGSAVPVDSYVLFGPFEASDPNLEMRYSGLVAQLAGDQDGVNWEVFVSDSPDVTGEVRSRGYLHAGRNDRVPLVARGTYFWLRLRNAAISQRWAFEAASIEMAPAGMRRVRS